MRVLLQRVTEASVSVEGEVIASIQSGLLLLVGFARGDEAIDLSTVADKITNLRVFSDENGRFQYSLVDLNADLLVVPQFTLYGSTAKGRRPDFCNALAPENAGPLFIELVSVLQRKVTGKTACGRFGADMQVSLVNNGPVTLMLEY